MSIPTISATLTKSGRQLTFRCPHCRGSHYHGIGRGHRVAHCWRPGSPYERTGYYLELSAGKAKIARVLGIEEIT
jgi:hypothetical protein